jgi:uncharacterized membrane protein YeaQ/YmgE (transglycosylase-associated protein family)
MLLAIIVLLVIGLIVGAIARFLVPGRDPMGFLGTALLGVAGSFVGGFLVNTLFGGGSAATMHPVGLLGSVVGSIVLLLILRVFRR